jgi:hypothetical protein
MHPDGNRDDARPSNGDDGPHERSDQVARPTIDDERIGTLIDGRVDGARRDELMAELAVAGEDDYLTFVETAAAIAELRGASDADAGLHRRPVRPIAEPGPSRAPTAPRPEPADDPKVIPLRPRAQTFRTPVIAGAVALAAILASAVVVPALRRRPSGPLDDAARAVAMVDAKDAPAPPTFGERPWSGLYRGAEAPMSDRGRAVRVGAYLVDLDLAQRHGDPRLRGLADTVAALVAEVPGGGAIAGLYRGIAEPGGDGDVRSTLAQGNDAVRDLLPPDGLEIGVWTETARVAAARRDAEFFHTDETQGALARAAKVELPPGAQSALDAIRAAMPANGPPDWPQLDAQLREFLREAAR